MSTCFVWGLVTCSFRSSYFSRCSRLHVEARNPYFILLISSGVRTSTHSRSGMQCSALTNALLTPQASKLDVSKEKASLPFERTSARHSRTKIYLLNVIRPVRRRRSRGICTPRRHLIRNVDWRSPWTLCRLQLRRHSFGLVLWMRLQFILCVTSTLPTFVPLMNPFWIEIWVSSGACTTCAEATLSSTRPRWRSMSVSS